MTTRLRLALVLGLALAHGAPALAQMDQMEVGGRPDADFGRADMETANTPEADVEEPADMEATNTPPAGFQNEDTDSEQGWRQELPPQ